MLVHARQKALTVTLKDLDVGVADAGDQHADEALSFGRRWNGHGLDRASGAFDDKGGLGGHRGFAGWAVSHGCWRRDQGYAATSWTEVLRTRRPSPEMHVGARAHAAGVVMGTASLCIRALKLQQLYTHYQQHCTRDEVPHTHTSATLPGLCHSPNTPQISHSLSPGDRTHHADTHAHTQQSGRCSSSVRHLLPSLLSAAKTSTHTHTAHTRLEGLRNSRAVVVITGRGRPCGLP